MGGIAEHFAVEQIQVHGRVRAGRVVPKMDGGAGARGEFPADHCGGNLQLRIGLGGDDLERPLDRPVERLEILGRRENSRRGGAGSGGKQDECESHGSLPGGLEQVRAQQLRGLQPA